jgi:putative peptidoglycan lipid II flippase
MAPPDLLKRSISLLLKSQTNILTAAFVIMGTVILSQLLGIVRQRLLVSIFGPSNILGIYDYALLIPDTIFQVTAAAALSSAFIPVFSDYLTKGDRQAANRMASTLLVMGLMVFFVISLVLFIVAPFILPMFNLAGQFNPSEMVLMANMMRIVLFGQMIFIVASFYTALLQSHNRFFIPGFAAALYNLGAIIGIWTLSPHIGIYAAPAGLVLGSLIYVLIQLPVAKKVGFSVLPTFRYITSEGVMKVFKLMGPRSLSIIIFQIGTLALASIISLLPEPGRMNLLYNLAKTLAFAPVSLFGLTIAQAAFPVLSREKGDKTLFKQTFISSLNQMLYLILPVSALLLVLRIPVVRLIYGADAFDWDATVLTGRILAYLSISIFAQGLTMLVYRAYWALHDTTIPLVVGTVSTVFIIVSAYVMIVFMGQGIEAIALSLTIGSILQLIILLIILNNMLGGFEKWREAVSLAKLFVCTLCTGFALYIPIKLLDQLVFETQYTVELIMLTGIASFAGLSLYLFLTWFLSVKEAQTYILMAKRLGNWKDILKGSDEVLEPSRSINS